MRAIEEIGIVGAGTMGHGIAQVAVQSGCRVTLVERRAGVGLEMLPPVAALHQPVSASLDPEIVRQKRN